MPTSSLSKFNIPLGFGLRKGVRLQLKNKVQQRSVFRPNITTRLSTNPDCVFGSFRKESQVAASVVKLHSCISGYTKSSYFSRSMATSGSVTASGDIIVDNFISSCGNVSNFARPVGHFVERNRSFHVASVAMKSRESSKINGVRGYFIYGVTHMANNGNTLGGKLGRRYNTSPSTCYSDGGLKETSHDEMITSLAIEADGKVVCANSLKLLSGSCYLPHPDKEATGGEDAHFILVEEQVIGVADGVGGWADVGINAGLYSRSLMSNSVNAIKGQPNEAIDPAHVLAKAHLATKAKGSSTACIIALKEEGLHAVNLGDSGFVVIRDGCTIFHSPVQQHDFNFTYQLANGNEGDQPSSGQVFKIEVAAGDVIVAGTDGLFDNLYNNEVTALVVQGVRSRVSPEVMAKNIADLARVKALDRKRQSPFATAAQEAGFRYHGGKLDDITVVVSFVTRSNDE
ncbi:probable protein phosphatase 2C 80 [Rutidosis leptorrhynchoides]|uniref:probable protein phosphatase 2C 80 n=1 Tax=Rutidosis leptorrhynchoides TaxID=125765 RepID=UPI003A999A51